jgi:hypothetical protein
LDHDLAGEVFGVYLKKRVQILKPALIVVWIFDGGDVKPPEEFNPVTQAVGMAAALQHLRIAKAREALSP